MNFKILSALVVSATLCFGYDKTDVPEGWASQGGGTTGGIGGTEVQVSSDSELKSAIGGSDKKIILVKPGTYSGFSIGGSNKSILGTAPGVLIKGQIKITGKNIIMRNIRIQDSQCGGGVINHDTHVKCGGGGDALSIGGTGAENIWLDHLDILDGQDGNCDVTQGPNNITITWCKFGYSYFKPHPFSNLIAGSDGETVSRGRLNITYAYNWWGDHIRERQPRGRFGKIHVLNNLYTSKRCNYILGPGVEMQMLIEHNVFNTSAVDTVLEGPDGYRPTNNDVVFDMGSSSSPGAWKSSGNIGTNPKDKNTNQGTVFTPPYTIKKYDASEVEALVRKNAGNVMTLGEVSAFEQVKAKSADVQPRITTTKSGWTLNNPNSEQLSFYVVTLQGKTVLQKTTLEAGKSFQLPNVHSTLLIKFIGNNSPSNIIVPFAE